MPIFEELDMKRFVVLTLLITCALTAHAQKSFTPSTYVKPGFPRLAVNRIANQNYDQPATQQVLARGSIALISTWPGWEVGRSMNLNQSIAAVKAINPNVLVVNYIKNNETVGSNSTGPYAALFTKLNSMSWYLYPNGTSGTPLRSSYAGSTAINNTTFTHPDSRNENWVVWFANWAYNQYIPSTPLLDGFVTDNVFVAPSVAGDWNLSGTTTSASSPNAALWQQQGYVQHFATLNKLMPGKFQLGNVATWGQSSSNLSLYQGMLQGGSMEGLIGLSYSIETWGGWSAMMSSVAKTMGALAEPKLGIFSMYANPTDYQGFRYGLTSCMLTDAYFSFNPLNSDGSEDDGNNPLFDEYAWQGKLGSATTSTPTTAWQKGVYRRDFANGIALVNPKGNGAQTVTLEANYTRITGTQAPSVNSGQTVLTLTLQDRDGIILMRNQATPAPSSVPSPPGNVTLH
jgi:hypothetical protein